MQGIHCFTILDMSKSDPIEKALNAIGELRGAVSPEAASEQLRTYLRNRSNLVAAKAAKLAASCAWPS